VATAVFFHAHPDDESITTGGVMVKAAAAGHRVVLVVATGGEYGEVPADLAPDETLVDRRRRETERSAAILGVHRVAWLGYRDSGMTGWEQNSDPEAFMAAPVDAAAERLAAILREERADVITVYDWHGNYGHPDHVQVHRVGHRAAELAGVARVFEATMNRDHVMRMVAMAREMGITIARGPEGEQPPEFDPNDTDDGNPFGMAESEITTMVDVGDVVDKKRASIAAHASQVTDTSFFLEMPPDVFQMAFGTEWFILTGGPDPAYASSLFSE
jgi:LmbE family N-acetylglucosaminyl deacetylase